MEDPDTSTHRHLKTIGLISSENINSNRGFINSFVPYSTQHLILLDFMDSTIYSTILILNLSSMIVHMTTVHDSTRHTYKTV